jgi:quercetin dioxygenase-like cupin family protein
MSRSPASDALRGSSTEYRGSQSSDYRTGDTFQAGKDTTHWLENKGTAPLVIIVADIFKQP